MKFAEPPIARQVSNTSHQNGNVVCTVVDICWAPPSNAMVEPNLTFILSVPGVVTTFDTWPMKVIRRTDPIKKKFVGMVHFAAAGRQLVSLSVFDGPACDTCAEINVCTQD